MSSKNSVDSLVYLNTEVLSLRNRRIQEYDIVEGGYSVARNNGLLPKSFLRKIEGMTKKQRHIEIGKYTLTDKTFNKALQAGFMEHVALFRERNEVKDEHVLSVKKDSITLFNTDISELEFDHVKFSLRDTSTSYMLLNKLEFFLNSTTKKFFFKGLPTGIEPVDNLVEEVQNLMAFREYKSREYIFEYLQEMRECYVALGLSHSYYRELSAVNSYKLRETIGSGEVYCDYMDDTQIEMIDVTYNYKNFLLPMIRLAV